VTVILVQYDERSDANISEKYYDCQRLTRASRHGRNRDIMIWLMPQLWEFFVSSSRAYGVANCGRSVVHSTACKMNLFRLFSHCLRILEPKFTVRPSIRVSKRSEWGPRCSDRTNPLTTQNVKVFFYLMPSHFRKSIAFPKVPRLSPSALLVRAIRRWWIWSTGGIILTRENRSTKKKPVPVQLSPKRISQRLAWDRIRASADANRLSHVTVARTAQ
jgi:hypothetical protein